MDFPKVSDITYKNILYKFVMKIQTPDILKSLGFCVNLLFKNHENRKKEENNFKNLYLTAIKKNRDSTDKN